MEWNSFFKVIVSEVAIIHAICGTFMPIFLVLIMTRFFGKNKSWTEGLSIFPFTIFASLSFTIPYLITGIFLGPEFPSILGGLFGLFIVTIAVKKRFLIPQDSWNFLPKSNWPKSWLGNINISSNDHKKKKISTMLAWLPYILLAILLVLSRTIETFRTFLQSINLSFINILNEEKINASLQILYLPGGILITVCIITFIVHRMSLIDISNAVKDSTKTILGAGFVLIFTGLKFNKFL